LGRPPTVQEVADKAGMSIKKISTVKSKMKAVATEAGFEADDGSSILQNSQNDYSSEAMDYVYNESDLKD
jgi:DNA-directed RNA polymerase specialized sigma subunit